VLAAMGVPAALVTVRFPYASYLYRSTTAPVLLVIAATE